MIIFNLIAMNYFNAYIIYFNIILNLVRILIRIRNILNSILNRYIKFVLNSDTAIK